MADIIKPDLCILGAGAAGVALAMDARSHGASVVLIDPGGPGDSLRSGPVPAAALAAAAARAHGVRTAGAFGMGNADPKPNFRNLHDHIQGVIADIAPLQSPERLTALGIELIAAPAAFIDRRTLKAGETVIRARRFVIASGSRPLVPALKNLDAVPFFTTDTIFGNNYKLSHLVILGGGATGMAFAQAYRRLGCAVTVVEAGKALANADPELAEIVLRRLREEGVSIHEQTQALELVPRSQGIGVPIRYADGSETALDASHILLALGRTPDFDGLALDKAGIKVDPQRPGQLLLRAGLRTANRRVHAIGEAAGSAPSLQAAQHDARVVLEAALFGRAARGGAVPQVVQTDPALAQIGLTEPEARQRFNTGYCVVRASFAENDRAIATRRGFGTAKVILDRHGLILGAAIAGPEAGELIALFALAMARGIKLPELADMTAAAPSFAGIAAALVAAWRLQAGPEPRRQRRLALIRLLP
jgi:pyruvate/2-oxoglutarate dehydrogenase complex dihydrolipoamide dehydrogenase (E3) component